MAKRITVKLETEKKCQFAGDPSDEYCSQCDGISIDIDGKPFAAHESCQSFALASAEPDPTPVTADAVPVNTVETGAHSHDVGDQDVSVADMDDYAAVGVTTAIRAESGLSMEMKDKKGTARWYKFTYTEERIVPASANLEEERAALWGTVHAEVDRQAQEITNYLNSL